MLSTGVEYAYMPIAMVLNNFVIMGIAAGYAIKSSETDKKKLGITYLVANAIGGVSEPALFGIVIPDKKTYPATIIGGAVAGLLSGLLRVGYYQFGPSNVFSVLGFVTSENTNNFLYGCISAVVAFAVPFAVMLVTYKTEKNN
jgi:PTS system beta-glucosides-specific IIC component